MNSIYSISIVVLYNIFYTVVYFNIITEIFNELYRILIYQRFHIFFFFFFFK